MIREQPTQVKTGKLRRQVERILLPMTLLGAVGVAFLVYQFIKPPSYTPPPYELNAILGKPEPAENVLYSILDTDKFTVGIAAVMTRREDNSVDLYFSNPSENKVYLLCEIFDEEMNTLYKSGLLRPGKYVESLPLIGEITDDIIGDNGEIQVKISVYALEQGTYHSIGTANIDNVLR